MQQVYHTTSDEIFHVHTSRCRHASSASDEDYVNKAIALGAKRIVFTDHAPFPENPFIDRMDMEELSGYISSINELKKQYKKQIEVLCGLEIEYLPSQGDYYAKLRDTEGIDLLVLGQHFYEKTEGGYSYDEEDKSSEYVGLCEAMIAGIKTNLFDVVAHPDRVFRGCESFGSKEIKAAKSIIWAAAWHGVYLEKNFLSMQRKNHYREGFWRLLPKKVQTIYGIDVHSLEDLEKGYDYYEKNKLVSSR